MLAGIGGALGALVTIGASEMSQNDMVKNYALEDPALQVKKRFLSSLESDLSLTNIKPIAEPSKSDELSELAKAFGKSTIIDFKTTRWFLTYFPTSWSRYRISYTATARLIQLEDTKIMWQGNCEFIGQDPETSPTWEELTANSGTILKAKMIEAANACAGDLLNQFFGKSEIGQIK
ncbi:MAG: hypothetical protein ACHQUC_02520 [Chlamydiales bacterium]